MGKYINYNSDGGVLSAVGKAEELIEDGATRVNDNTFQENMICVVSNGLFDAAGYAFSEKEFEHFKQPDGRNKIWLIHPLAKDLAE